MFIITWFYTHTHTHIAGWDWPPEFLGIMLLRDFSLPSLSNLYKSFLRSFVWSLIQQAMCWVCLRSRPWMYIWQTLNKASLPCWHFSLKPSLGTIHFRGLLPTMNVGTIKAINSWGRRGTRKLTQFYLSTNHCFQMWGLFFYILVTFWWTWWWLLAFTTRLAWRFWIWGAKLPNFSAFFSSMWGLTMARIQGANGHVKWAGVRWRLPAWPQTGCYSEKGSDFDDVKVGWGKWNCSAWQ